MHARFAGRLTTVPKRLTALLGVMGVLLVAYAQADPPKASAQDHYNFCAVTLAPYGQYGDRCYAVGGGYLRGINMQAYQHSGCATTAVVSSGELTKPWTCLPAGGGTLGLTYSQNTDYLKAVLRNNTTGSATSVTGAYFCWNQC